MIVFFIVTCFRYFKLNLDDTIAQALQGKRIVEHPSIIVALDSEVEAYNTDTDIDFQRWKRSAYSNRVQGNDDDMGVLQKKQKIEESKGVSGENPTLACDRHVKHEIPDHSNHSKSNELVKNTNKIDGHVSRENINETSLNTSSELSSRQELEEGEISDE